MFVNTQYEKKSRWCKWKFNVYCKIIRWSCYVESAHFSTTFISIFPIMNDLLWPKNNSSRQRMMHTNKTSKQICQYKKNFIQTLPLKYDWILKYEINILNNRFKLYKSWNISVAGSKIEILLYNSNYEWMKII